MAPKDILRERLIDQGLMLGDADRPQVLSLRTEEDENTIIIEVASMDCSRAVQVLAQDLPVQLDFEVTQPIVVNLGPETR